MIANDHVSILIAVLRIVLVNDSSLVFTCIVTKISVNKVYLLDPVPVIDNCLEYVCQ